MSYLERIRHCNNYDLESALTFMIEGEKLGLTARKFAEHLKAYPDIFHITDDSIALSPELHTPQMRTAASAPVFVELHESGVIDTWVGEDYPIVQQFGETPRMLVERASSAYLGTRGFGVHINGLVKKHGEVFVWVGVRTKKKPFWPGKLDQLVAGGQPHGIGLMENVIKESKEEANIPEPIASQAEYITALSYCGQGERGLDPATLFVYDLWLDEDFEPQNTDGEVEEFHLLSLREVADLVDNTDEFKDNCNLVNIDLLIRHHLIDASHPEFALITHKLYAKPIDF